MKTAIVLRISFALALLGYLFLGACKGKTHEPEPDAATSVAGMYTVSYLSFNGQGVNLPQNGVSATMQLTRTNETTIQVALEVNDNGNKETTDLGALTVARQTDGTVNLTDQGQQIGTIKNKQLSVSGSDGTDSIEIKAVRQ